MTESRLLLASASPRRREILTGAGFHYESCPANILERIPDGTPPRQAAVQLALQKARAVAADHPADIVLGADTVVALDGLPLGKPEDAADAARMLARLSGRSHAVDTGVSVCGMGREETFVCETQVVFYPLTRAQIHAYIATGEPMDKAGAYGIQSRGSLLVRSISGDYFNVVGLPINETARVLKRFGIVPDWLNERE